MRHTDHGGEPKILSPRFQVSEEGPMHLAVVRKLFLRAKTPLNSDLTDSLAETP
jgi:hypothetical protein